MNPPPQQLKNIVIISSHEVLDKLAISLFFVDISFSKMSILLLRSLTLTCSTFLVYHKLHHKILESPYTSHKVVCIFPPYLYLLIGFY